MIKKHQYILLFALCCLLSCSNHNEGNHHGVMKTIHENETDSVHVNIEELMQDVKKVLAKVPEDQKQFYVLERQSMLTSYPCSNCHNVPLEQLNSDSQSELKKSHWNIALKHAKAEIMDCQTCHSEGNLEELTLISGKPLSFDHSYQQCAQCHSTQYNDWLGGAHGKRVAGWGEPKLIYSCVSCHNPHKPAFESRWPARLNTVKIKERDGE
jgi:hypothetical protein